MYDSLKCTEDGITALGRSRNTNRQHAGLPPPDASACDELRRKNAELVYLGNPAVVARRP